MRLVPLALLIASQALSAEPGFEVASIKPNTSADMNGTWRFTNGGRFSGENINVRFLISTAYRLRDFQLSGVPGWAESAKYDIVAKGEGNPSEEQMMAMLQGLLVDRFKLKYHNVTKDAPVYALLAAKNGVKLRESKEGPCAAADTDKRDVALCSTWYSRRNQIDAKRITMPQFAIALATQLDRPVIDKTGFDKTFDAHLEWTPAEIANDPNGEAGASIYTAIQERLGLKLESQKGPVEFLVVDRIEKPEEN